MGWLIALGVLTLIAILPVGVSALYDEDGPFVRVIAGPVRIRVFPIKKKKTDKKEKPKKEKKQKKQKEKPKKTGNKKKKEQKKGGSIQDFLPLVDKVLAFLGSFRRKLRITNLQMKLVMASSDPCDLAVNYGKAWAALGNLMPLLENVFVIRKRNLEVECDFLADKTLISARLDISITIGRVIAVLVVKGIPILLELLKIMNKRKGGAKA